MQKTFQTQNENKNSFVHIISLHAKLPKLNISSIFSINSPSNIV